MNEKEAREGLAVIAKFRNIQETMNTISRLDLEKIEEILFDSISSQTPQPKNKPQI